MFEIQSQLKQLDFIDMGDLDNDQIWELHADVKALLSDYERRINELIKKRTKKD